MVMVMNSPGTLEPGTNLVLFGSVPEEIRPAMRTLDPDPRAGAGRAGERTIRDLMAEGKTILQEIEAASRERQGGEEGGTRLAFAQTRNRATGKWGIVVHRHLASGDLSGPLAELLLAPPFLLDDFKKSADELAGRASSGSLRMVGFEDSGSETPRPAVFAAARDSEGLWLFARMLITPFEIGQWAVDDERGS